MTQLKPLDRLIAMGFTPCGEWSVQDDSLILIPTECADARNVLNTRNVLYAFVIGDAVMYIGKTVNTLKKRMQGYRFPGQTQPTNRHNKEKILEAIESGKRIMVYVLPDNGLLKYGGFHVNLAAGLEDDLIRQIRPPWNGGNKETAKLPLATSL